MLALPSAWTTAVRLDLLSSAAKGAEAVENALTRYISGSYA